MLIALMLGFAIGVAPGHVATLSSHDGCEICALIHHPPVLQIVDAASLNPDFRRSWLDKAMTPPEASDPRTGSIPSRSPPFLF